MQTSVAKIIIMRLLPLWRRLACHSCGKADDSALVSGLAPTLNPAVIAEAVAAMKCAQNNGVGQSASRLAIIDYTIPSRQQRLWVIDLNNRTLLFKEHVAHGQGSGGDIPTHFQIVRAAIKPA